MCSDEEVTALLGRAQELATEMPWQAVAQVEFYLRIHASEDSERGSRLLAAMQPRCVSIFDSIESGLAERETALTTAVLPYILDAIDEWRDDRGGGQSLLVDVPKRARKPLKRILGSGVTRWNRFCDDAKAVAPWQAAGSGSDAEVAVVRQGTHKEGMAVMVRAVAGRLKPGATILLYGLAEENTEAMRATLGQGDFFRGARLLLSQPEPDAVLVMAERSAEPAPELTLHDMRRTERVVLTDEGVKWRTVPGLFAGGGIDIMTAYLLETLRDVPAFPEGTQIVDFCCGSGVIGATLLCRQPKLNLHLLDADAIAVKCAERNVPLAAGYHISDGWAALPMATSFDVIVSNPPVHSGHASAFGVVRALIAGCHTRLRPGGDLWIVAQTNVPVGRMLAEAAGAFEDRIELVSDGRFSVWHATRRTEGNGEAAAARKRKRDRSPRVA